MIEIETPPAGLEPATYPYEGIALIHLSYGGFSILSWVGIRNKERLPLGQPFSVAHALNSSAFASIPS
jgi:hypothetical protein